MISRLQSAVLAMLLCIVATAARAQDGLPDCIFLECVGDDGAVAPQAPPSDPPGGGSGANPRPGGSGAPEPNGGPLPPFDRNQQPRDGADAGSSGGGSGIEPSPTGHVVTYRAYISAADIHDPSGARLTNAAAIIQQDRANVHRFRRIDLGDLIDGYFTTHDRRRELFEHLNGALPSDLSRKIIDGNIMIEVRVHLSGQSIASIEVYPSN